MNLFNDEFWRNEFNELWAALLGIFVETLMDGTLGGMEALPLELSMLVDFDVVNENAIKLAREYRYEWISKINDTTRTQVQTLVADWIRAGEPLKSLESQLAPIFGSVRAEMIAATEVTRVFAMANSTAWQSTGFVNTFTWNTAQDERVCPICGPRAGQEYPLNDPMAHPPAHVRCRCWETPVVNVDTVNAILQSIDLGR